MAMIRRLPNHFHFVELGDGLDGVLVVQVGVELGDDLLMQLLLRRKQTDFVPLNKIPR